MIRRRLVPVPALALVGAAALALGVSACAPDDATPRPSRSPGSSSASTSASPSAASPSPSASSGGSSAACLVGTWTMDQAGLDDFYSDVNTALAGAGATFTPQGSATLALNADGTFGWMPDTRVSAAVSGTTIMITIGGQLGGAYTATADRISADTTSTDGLQVSATIDGAPTDAGDITQQIAGAPMTDSSYTCTDDELTLRSDIGGAATTAVLHRG